jgi:hypothetical protein
MVETRAGAMEHGTSGRWIPIDPTSPKYAGGPRAPWSECDLPLEAGVGSSSPASRPACAGPPPSPLLRMEEERAS